MTTDKNIALVEKKNRDEVVRADREETLFTMGEYRIAPSVTCAKEAWSAAPITNLSEYMAQIVVLSICVHHRAGTERCGRVERPIKWELDSTSIGRTNVMIARLRTA